MRALSVKDDFVASVSHELRTPLTSIIGYLDLAQDSGDDLPADIAHFLTVASRNADRLLVLVSDLLTAASAERVAMELERTGTDLSALVRLSVDDAAEVARNGGVTMHTRVEPVPTAMLDPVRVQHVVENLLSNAVEYTKPGGSVTTSLALVDSEIVLEVADTGTGISASAGPYSDPTTAVQAIDRIHDILRQMVRRPLHDGRYHDRGGTVRLVVPTMQWHGFVQLAFDEIRQVGAGSPQVSRRLTSALEDLLTVAPEDRRAPLDKQPASLNELVSHMTKTEADREAGMVADPAGIGSATALVTPAQQLTSDRD